VTHATGKIKPVIIHYLGLIDPVCKPAGGKMDATNTTLIPDNVHTVRDCWAGLKSKSGRILYNATPLIRERSGPTPIAPG